VKAVIYNVMNAIRTSTVVAAVADDGAITTTTTIVTVASSWTNGAETKD
jgi:hypothetical protein